MTSETVSSSLNSTKFVHKSQPQTMQDQPINIVRDSDLNESQNTSTIYTPYSNTFNRPHDYFHIPYASNVYGVYRRPPSHLKSPPSIYTNRSKCINQGSKSHHSMLHQLSTSISDDYYNSKYDDLNDLINTIYSGEKKNENDTDYNTEEHNPSIFTYTFNTTGVSLR